MRVLRDDAVPQKKLFSILCALSMLLISMPIANGAHRKSESTFAIIQSRESAADQDGTFEKVWVEHDVRVDEKKGMRIHARFVVKNSLNAECTLVAHFYKNDGTQLSGADLQGDYSTSDGHVVTYIKVKPRFTSTRYADKSLFIPYQEFKIKGAGSYQLKFILFLERHDQADRVLAKSEEFNFRYSKKN